MIRICNRILNASTVDIFATGFCEAIGSFLQSGLQSVNIPCTLQNNINLFYLNNIVNRKHHVAILLSIDNNDQSIISIAETLQEYHIYRISFSNNKYNQLSQLCQDTILFDTISLPNYNDAISTGTSIISMQYSIIFLISLIFGKKQNIIEKY
ncbi:MAG: hypothetical protein LUG12_05375 [Erysipelotrichaceae bacterium]|nr:hypothetical protein [Erysipelotrichaceae bacterium]